MRGGDDGYSLLELLVALALTAVIATMMTAMIRQLHPLRQIQAKYDAQQVADRIVEVIALDLQSAVALPLLDSDSRQAMMGGSHDIRFVAVVRTGYATEGLREVSYSLQPMPNGTRKLVRTIALRRFGDHQDPQLVQTDDLLDGVGELTFTYLSRAQQDRVLWVDHWDLPEEMPAAVRLAFGVAVSGKDVIAERIAVEAR